MDNDVQDTGSAPDAPAPDHRSRRRLIGAGLVGLAGSLLPQFAARVAAGSTDDTDPGSDAGDANSGGAGSPDDTTSDTLAPTGSAGSTQGTGGAGEAPDGSAPAAATTTTAPARRPTAEDTELLGFAQSVELAAVSLYDTAIAGDATGDSRSLFVTLREAHLSYVHSLGGLLGRGAPGTALTGAISTFSAGFGGSFDDLVAAAYDLEATALATHTDLIGQLTGTDGAGMIASMMLAEARHCTVLAHLSGASDLDSLLLSDAEALAPTKG